MVRLNSTSALNSSVASVSLSGNSEVHLSSSQLELDGIAQGLSGEATRVEGVAYRLAKASSLALLSQVPLLNSSLPWLARLTSPVIALAGKGRLCRRFAGFVFSFRCFKKPRSDFQVSQCFPAPSRARLGACFGQ